jgi:hypothetical protein
METMKTFTRDEFEKSLRIERQILRKLRSAYETLQDVQSLLDGHADLLTRTPSMVPDIFDQNDHLGKAMIKIDDLGSQLYGQQETMWPFGDNDPSEEEYEKFLDKQIEMGRYWVDEGRPDQVCAACQAEAAAASAAI